MIVHVAVIAKTNETRIFTGKTNKSLESKVAQYCKDHWSEVITGLGFYRCVAEQPKIDGELIARYFALHESDILKFFGTSEIED